MQATANEDEPLDTETAKSQVYYYPGMAYVLNFRVGEDSVSRAKRAQEYFKKSLGTQGFTLEREMARLEYSRLTR